MTQELGFVETPAPVATCIANNLIERGRDGRILYPGLGRGRIRDAVARVAQQRNATLDEVGVERNETRVAEFERTNPDAGVEVQHSNFLLNPPVGEFDYVAMNPPYVRHSKIPCDERARYENTLALATGTYDLYQLFVEQALDLLAPDGTMVVIIPTTWYAAKSTAEFRGLIAAHSPYNHILVPDDAFDVNVSTCILGFSKTPEEPWTSSYLNLARPHPYDVMDLQECATFGEGYADRIRDCQRTISSREFAEPRDRPRQLAFADFCG